MKLAEYLDKELLKKHIEDGLVMANNHETLPLILYCYSKKCVLDWHWDDVTEKCRGLIVDILTDDIIARPFPKFFNIDTEGRPETFVDAYTSTPKSFGESQGIVTEKLDGSLGIFWKYNQHWGVASKGSFHSEHAEWATKWLEDKVEHHGALIWPIGYTPLFEMICEDIQHHVVHYGKERQGLHLLALINNETGEELNTYSTTQYATVNYINPVESYYKNLSQILKEDRENAEGYVVTYPIRGESPLKVKIKHDTFLKFQKIHHSATPKNIFKLLREGRNDIIEEYIANLPVENAHRVTLWVKEFNRKYSDILGTAYHIVHNGLRTLTTRKEFAEYFNQPENKIFASICFGLLDNTTNRGMNRYKHSIWNLVEKNVNLKGDFDGTDY